jgi:acetyl-CoA carboxylase biotin carboxyl carrier protein
MSDESPIDRDAAEDAGAPAPPEAVPLEVSGAIVPHVAADPASDPGPDPDPPIAATTASRSGEASLLALIDRLSGILQGSDLDELEIESGGTTLVLRSPRAVAPPWFVAGEPGAAAVGGGAATAVAAAVETPAVETRPAVLAPLTGIWYSSPTPGSAPYVRVGGEVAEGQVIGLIEAMKLFNEIKSDRSGRVVRVVAEDGTLVKAKQPLIEVEPL